MILGVHFMVACLQAQVGGGRGRQQSGGIGKGQCKIEPVGTQLQ